MGRHLKSMNRKVWEVVEKDFVVLDPNDPTPREEEKLQLNDIVFSMIYNAVDQKVFEQIKDLESAFEVWKILEDSYESTLAIKDVKLSFSRSS